MKSINKQNTQIMLTITIRQNSLLNSCESTAAVAQLYSLKYSSQDLLWVGSNAALQRA